MTPRGLDASAAAAAEGLDGRRTVALDTLYPFAATRRRTLMTTPATDPTYRDAAHGLFACDGVPVTVIRDSGGFVAQRIVACIVNIACDIAQQRIATPADIDLAVTLGLGYPQGRWRWAIRSVPAPCSKCCRISPRCTATRVIARAHGCCAARAWASRC